MWSFITTRVGCHVWPVSWMPCARTICGKVRRDPVPGTLEVYPLKGYGAMASGLHRFCDSRKHHICREGNSGDAKFVTLWRKQKGRWRMSRVVSYDHK